MMTDIAPIAAGHHATRRTGKITWSRSWMMTLAATVATAGLTATAPDAEAAAIYKITGSGTITSVDPDLAGNGFAAGDAFTWSALVDGDTPDSDPVASFSGIYNGAIDNISYDLNGYKIDLTGGQVQVADTSFDTISLNSFDNDQTALLSDLNGFDFSRSLNAFNLGNLLSSDALDAAIVETPNYTGQTSFIDYEGKRINLQFNDVSTHVVPAPGAAVSVLIGGGIMALRRRRSGLGC